MSDPKRYDPQIDHSGEFDIVMVKHPDGEFVRWEDYAHLKAEVERLRKAGDAMANALNLDDDVFDNHDKKEAQSNWNAAKDGKTSA